ncbi:MAG: hypothetical protein HC906_04520 [Bacteroidales bacterium]|nr:hypothetical protein [Bacteroidales bacterium]
MVNEYSLADISGIYNLHLIQDTVNKVVISGSNHVNDFKCDQRNDSIFINSGKKINFNTAKNNLTLHFSSLTKLVTNDPVTLSNRDTLKFDHFTLWNIGEIAEVNLTFVCNFFYFANSANTLGHFYFKGSAGFASFFNRYGSSVFADSLYCKSAEIYNESVGDFYIRSEGEVKIYIWGPGNIYISEGSIPNVVESKGDGKIIFIPD